MNKRTMDTVKVINIFIVGISLFATTCWANNDLKIKYKWNTIDFKYEPSEERNAAIDQKTFIPENVIPVSLDVYGNRLFVSMPRFRSGVPATLATIDLKGKNKSKII